MGDSQDQGRPAKRIKLSPHPQPSRAPSHSQARPRRQRPIRPAPTNTPDPAEAAPVAAAFHVIPSTRGGRRVRRRGRGRGRGRGGRAASGTDTSRPLSQVPEEVVIDASPSPASTESTPSSSSTSTLPQEQLQVTAAAIDTPIEMTLIPLDNAPHVASDPDSSNSISPPQEFPGQESPGQDSTERESSSPQDLLVSAASPDRASSSQAEQEPAPPKAPTKAWI
ncbi:hypothetical protein TrVGV298_004298 [Trichoderma virens]|nr:hypothetical protein TrVGV298_004298 [Trichoderma virens]